jgi:phosphate transport system substrate-binding protein
MINATLMLRWSGAALLALGLLGASCKRKTETTEATVSSATAAPTDKKKESIQNIGSDTMVNLAQAWAEEYGKLAPNVSIEVSGGGSGVGIAALINGTANIANASRKLEPEELEKAKKQTGKEPQEFMVGYDGLAIYVSKSNPIEEISLENNSGTYHYFREVVIGKKADYKSGSLDMNGSKDVVELVAKTPGAIGYSGLGYATGDVKIVKVSKKKGEPAVMPAIASVLDKTYPISRPLFMYTPGEPDPQVKAYLSWIMAEPGQKIVEKSGYVPLNKK